MITFFKPTLGVLALIDGSKDKITQEMIEITNWLSRQRGFGFFSSVTAKQRLMYAGIITQLEYINTDAMQSTALNSAISLIAAQEAAMCAAIAASVEASSSES
ncbi:MAG: DUF4003 family protein [Clostridiales bacterium]|jgi:hypothetical protein|nr:DUF4003 family protein [Bacillota bacterium]NLK03891.1 DUF4003 family protein [Clostridiales bacterium]